MLQAQAKVTEDLWRLLYFFGLYRMVLGGTLLLLTIVFGSALSPDSYQQNWVQRSCLVYILLAILALAAVQLKKPRFSLQLSFQMGADIIVLTMMSHFSGGVQSGLSILMLASLAAAGLISRGKISLLFAALASIAILLEHAYAVLTDGSSVALFFQAGMLSAAFFVVAWLSHTLSRYAIASEKLAISRGVDLSNMAEANRLMIQEMSDGVLMVDERGDVRQFNTSAKRLLGISFQTDGKKTLGDCSPLLEAMFAAWRQNKSLGQEVLRLPTTNWMVKVRFLPVQREGFWGAIIVLEDMQRLQEQAQQAKLAALGRLTANIAHEVRNPLSSISYAAELLQEGQQDQAQNRLTQIILDNAARLNRIVQDVLQLNRRDRVAAEPINLVEHLRGFAEELCQAKRLPLSTIEVVAPEACEVKFDRGHFDQILWNLGQNALRYCQNKPGSVKMNLYRSPQDGQVILDMTNDGSAISEETASKLFEPFFTTDAGGTGLGLFIGRELCEANGAVLEYVPVSPDGACFRIKFGASHGS